MSQNPYFSVVKKQLNSYDGSSNQYYFVEFPRPAVGVLVTRGTDVLLIRQYRPIVDEYVWAIPSGGVSQEETPAEAAARELEEETGFRATSLVPWMNCYASYGGSNQRFEIFWTSDAVENERGFDPAEVMSIRWFNRAELRDLILSNGVVDNLSLSPLFLFLFKLSESGGKSFR
ncbi:MAG TPA: NUDIX hydrolase [Candidatus Acidoferrum sp.]|nr:NUDIX hydrolase [Candidatus Acidoferrum sp.]